MDHGRIANVLAEVAEERYRQICQWGDQSSLPLGTGGYEYQQRSFDASAACERAAAAGDVTWRHILNEEFWEVLAESDPRLVRMELIQVAAVAVAMIESIDRNARRDTLIPDGNEA